MKRFSASTSIHAAPDKIWAILTDAARYPKWNPTVTKVDGRIAAGETVTVHVTINPGRAFPVKVSTFEPPSRMIWTGGMPLGLFTGVRTFTLTPSRDGSIQFGMQEVHSGLLAGLIGKSIPDLQPAFDDFALALKQEAER